MCLRATLCSAQVSDKASHSSERRQCLAPSLIVHDMTVGMNINARDLNEYYCANVRQTNRNAACCAAGGTAHRHRTGQTNECRQINDNLQAENNDEALTMKTEADDSPERDLPYGARPSPPVLLNRRPYAYGGGCCAEARRRADNLVDVVL